MNNTASLLVLIFLSITFIFSAHEKVFYWKDNLAWIQSVLDNSRLKKFVPQCVFVLLIIELIAGVLCFTGIIQLYLTGVRTLGFYGAVASCVALLLMLFGMRMAKDYDGARNIIIYFIPAVLAVYWLG